MKSGLSPVLFDVELEVFSVVVDVDDDVLVVVFSVVLVLVVVLDELSATDKDIYIVLFPA